MSCTFRLKLAQESDLMDVFNLSNDPVVRQNSLSPNPILLENHIAWFKNIITSEVNVFYIVKDNLDNFIGQVRFDKSPDQNLYTISISLTQYYRGKGLGTEIIKKASKELLQEKNSAKILAFVKDNNQSSIKSFIKAGYKVVDTQNVNNNLCARLMYYDKD